jgi:hypothetical protein
MKPGPKAKRPSATEQQAGINLGWLRAQAHVCNGLLYDLRDGYPGRLTKRIEVSRIKTIGGKTWRPAIELAIVFPGRERQARQLVRAYKGWEFVPPEPPRPELWKRLKDAHSAAEVRQLARRICKIFPTAHWEYLHARAEDFIKAKSLHNYPRSSRSRSDDKRIHFCAKVLSGLMQGISPATATKRLAHLVLPDGSEIKRMLHDDAARLNRIEYRTILQSLMQQKARKTLWKSAGGWLMNHTDFPKPVEKPCGAVNGSGSNPRSKYDKLRLSAMDPNSISGGNRA